MQKSDVLLEIRNIQASYKEYPALNNVSLDIKKKYSTWSSWRIRFRKDTYIKKPDRTGS